MARRRCPHCSGVCVTATSQEVVALNLALEDHALCLWGDAWEICFSRRAPVGDGQVIRDKAGARKGVLYTLN